MAGRPADPLDAVVRATMALHRPGYRIASVAPIGAGLDHQAYEVNGELIVRFDDEPDRARRAVQLRREARLLVAVAEVAPLPVPRPAFTDAEHGALAYPKLPGVPLLDVSGPRRSEHAASIAGALGRLLSALHTVPVDHWAGLVSIDDHPLTAWRGEAAQTYETVAGLVAGAHRPSVERFLAAPLPSGGYQLTFSHADLGIEHVLVDPVTWTVTGVIDWSDAALVDPAIDFGLLYRDLGPTAVRAALDAYGGDTTDSAATDSAAIRERLVFYARCKVLEDLAYGVATNRTAYIDKSLTAMGWLFPDTAVIT
jgi:aminoglycoside phosphotransferase (APT) family kinase protein